MSQLTVYLMEVLPGINLGDVFGYAGGFLSAISFFPQVLKIIKTKTAKDLSIVTLILLSGNTLLWLVYALITDSKPLWMTNAFVLALIVCMIILKIYYKRMNAKKAKAAQVKKNTDQKKIPSPSKTGKENRFQMQRADDSMII